MAEGPDTGPRQSWPRGFYGDIPSSQMLRIGGPWLASVESVRDLAGWGLGIACHLARTERLRADFAAKL